MWFGQNRNKKPYQGEKKGSGGIGFLCKKKSPQFIKCGSGR